MRENHKTRVLKYLKEYGSITSLDAIRDLGNTRLSATIFSLRQDEYNIVSKMIKVPTRWNTTTEVAQYTLN